MPCTGIGAAACDLEVSIAWLVYASLTMARERAQTPLVGSEAPEFTAEAVFDQEFVTLSLSQYRVRMRHKLPLHLSGATVAPIVSGIQRTYRCCGVCACLWVCDA